MIVIILIIDFKFELVISKLKLKKIKSKYGSDLTDDCPDDISKKCFDECKEKKKYFCFCKNYDYFNQFLHKCVCIKDSDEEKCNHELNDFYTCYVKKIKKLK
jgi:hypothetical protein